MDIFHGVEFAVLQMWRCDSYLLADEDGRSVYHGSLGGRASLINALWAVEEIVAGAPPTRAYGRYLGTGAPDARDRDRERCPCCPLPCYSLEASQRDRDEPDVDDIMWRAIGCSDPHGIVLLHDRSGRYLRGNKSFLSCHHSVSVDGNIDNEETLRWEVVPVPRTGIPNAIDVREHAIDVNVACSPSLRREIRFVKADAAGNFAEEDWQSFRYTGRSVQLLREELERRVGYGFTLCVRAGRHGCLPLLLINLPRSPETLHIVLIRPSSDDLLAPLLPPSLLKADETLIPLASQTVGTAAAQVGTRCCNSGADQDLDA
uniref:DUF569 domain-containing protein n=1 Tax=Oryza brachyantha TaxID=4533 RepID=J3MIX0_ORYBR